MTALYGFYKFIVPNILRAYYGKVTVVNDDRVQKGEVILFVANHPSALMDPLVCGAFAKVPIHFLGRADLFKSGPAAWFLRNSHMWPIYRDVDGRENLDKNEAVFKECYASLKEGNPILLYGEGFTDEQFIRRVKKIKKGPSRIAFGGEEAYDFKLGLKIIPLGVNYTNPDVYSSDLMLRYGKPIVMSDFEEVYRSNPVKAMLEVTRRIETHLLDEVIHIEIKERTTDVELILELDEHHVGYTHLQGAPRHIDRWTRTKKVVDHLNAMSDEGFRELAEKTRNFWKNTQTPSAERFHFIQLLKKKNPGVVIDAAMIGLMLPFALIGAVLNLPVFVLLNTLPKKLTKRSCFYPGLKIGFSMLFFPILLLIPYNIIALFIDTDWWMYFPFAIAAAFLGHIALRTRQRFIHLTHKMRAAKRFAAISNKEVVQREYASLHEQAGW
jgi:glycerol-3-phosphate O-acyltransferase/dihydroxyacetone phosphate acyltransferase